MGKYQLDYKGQAQVQRFHEKHSTGGGNQKKNKIEELRNQFLSKKAEKKVILSLRRPNIADKEKILEMFQEFQANSPQLHGCFNLDCLDYEAWLEQNLQYEMGFVPSTFVPNIEYVLVNQDDQMLGFLNLRLRLNQSLLDKSGHIGFSIRPTEQLKGYGKKILGLGLVEAARNNLQDVLVTCHVSNNASRAVILANGGSFEDIRNEMERYWIHIMK